VPRPFLFEITCLRAAPCDFKDFLLLDKRRILEKQKNKIMTSRPSSAKTGKLG